QEMEKEKGVIMDEIASYLDSPEESVMDDFEDQVFRGHALGHNILGTAADLQGFSRQDILDFIRQNYNTHELVIGISGNYPLKKVRRLAERIFGDIPERNTTNGRTPPLAAVPQQVTQAKPINQVHQMIGRQA